MVLHNSYDIKIDSFLTLNKYVTITTLDTTLYQFSQTNLPYSLPNEFLHDNIDF